MTQNEKPAGIPDEMSLRNLSNQGSLKAASKELLERVQTDEEYARRLSGIPINRTFELPSTEQMRHEVETGEFSPESLAIARSIQAEALGLELTPMDERGQGILEQSLADRFGDAEELDWWATQEHFGAPLPEEIESTERLRRNAERKRIEAQKRDRSRMWREEATKSITPATAHFKQIATEAKKTTKAFKKIAKAIPQKPAPGAKLQHRPFLILAAIRDEL